MLCYKLAEQGSVFSTRSRGVRILADLEARLNDVGTPIVLDFSGVTHISYSFADEFVGNLMQRVHDADGQLPRIENVEPPVLDIIELNLRNRALHPLPMSA